MRKLLVEDTRKLDINWLLKTGGLKVGNHSANRTIKWTRSGYWKESEDQIGYELSLSEVSNSYMRMLYTLVDHSADEEERIDYKIQLTTTPCHFGNFRFWFVCPGNNCGKRVGTLYFGTRYFLCRHCLGLAYRNQFDSRRFRALGKLFDRDDRADRLRNKVFGRYGRKLYRNKPTKNYAKYLWYSYGLGLTQRDFLEIDRLMSLKG